MIFGRDVRQRSCSLKRAVLILWRFLLALFFLFAAGAGVPGTRAAETNASPCPENRNVQVLGRKERGQTVLYAQLKDCSQVTLKLDVSLGNMAASQPLPLVVDSKGRTRFDLVTLRVEDPVKSYSYYFTYKSLYGRRTDAPTNSYIYSLPYTDARYPVTQAAGGTFSHQRGSINEEAIDWGMPVGTTVRAARPGIVAAVWQESDMGGPDKKYVNCANFVLIDHQDGTFGEYLHLKKGGALVKLGQKVNLHDPIGLSGDTGMSTHPHLHFAAFYVTRENVRKTLPLQFRGNSGQPEVLLDGRRY